MLCKFGFKGHHISIQRLGVAIAFRPREIFVYERFGLQKTGTPLLNEKCLFCEKF